MSDFDDVIPGSDGQPAGQGQLDVDYCPNERHDRPKMTSIPVYARATGNRLLCVGLTDVYRNGELGNILAPDGSRGDIQNGEDVLVVFGREGSMPLAFAIDAAMRPNVEDLKWQGPTPKP